MNNSSVKLKTAERLPKFTDENAVSVDVINEIMKSLERICMWNAENFETELTEYRKNNIRIVFNSWIKYWAHQASFLNEIKVVLLPPLPGMPPEELTDKGLRRERESISYHIAVAIFPLMYQIRRDEHPKWALELTSNDFWLVDWGSLEINPPSLDEPSAKLTEMRKENEEKRRAEEREGPKRADLEDKTKLLPEQVFSNAFEGILKPTETPKETVPSFSSKLLWYYPVSKYSQRNVYDAVMLLTERINDYPYCEEVVLFIELLTARIGYLLSVSGDEKLFDIDRYRDYMPEFKEYRCNRVFIHWCAFYFYELLQRVHYASIMMNLRITEFSDVLIHKTDEMVAALKESIAYLAKDMGRDDFLIMYKLCYDEYYDFPGDDNFVRVLHPGGVGNRGDILMELRQERQAPLFFSETSLDVATILEKVITGTSHISRIFILNLLDRFFSMESGIAFRNAVVIDQSGIQMSQFKIIESSVPCLISIFSAPFLNYKFAVYENYDLYETLVAWLLYIRHEKNGFVLRKNISTQIRFLLGEDKNQTKRIRAALNILIVREEELRDDYDEFVDCQGRVVKPL